MAQNTNVTVRTTGTGPTLQQALQHIQTQCQDLAIKAAMAGESEAKQKAPVDTGNLRNSIKATPTGADSAKVATNVHYAIHQEYGTRNFTGKFFMSAGMQASHDFIEKELTT